MEDDYGEVDRGEEQGEPDYAEERARDEYEAEMDAKSGYESQMSAQAEAEAQSQFENEPKSNDLTAISTDFDMKLKTIAETLQGQIEEIRQRIEALEKK